MKSYLSLIPISAAAHRRQNRMTLLCITFSVFMVTAVFSMAEMGARMEQTRLSEKHDNLPFKACLAAIWASPCCRPHPRNHRYLGALRSPALPCRRRIFPYPLIRRQHHRNHQRHCRRPGRSASCRRHSGKAGSKGTTRGRGRRHR